MSDRIKIAISDGIADVQLGRPDKMNAFDEPMVRALISAGEELQANGELCCVVLSGEGRAFSAGLDMQIFAALTSKDRDAKDNWLLSPYNERTNHAQQCIWTWRELEVPVIAAIQGVAIGAGFQLALAADMRFATPDARFSIMEINWGLIPDMAGTQLMRHLARDDIVRELTYTGRIFSADEARDYGFLTRIVDDPRNEARRIAAEIAGMSPDAIRAAKRVLNAAVTSDVGSGLKMEVQEQIDLIGTPNQLEAVSANREKRAGKFAAPKTRTA